MDGDGGARRSVLADRRAERAAVRPSGPGSGQEYFLAMLDRYPAERESITLAAITGRSGSYDDWLAVIVEVGRRAQGSGDTRIYPNDVP